MSQPDLSHAYYQKLHMSMPLNDISFRIVLMMWQYTLFCVDLQCRSLFNWSYMLGEKMAKNFESFLVVMLRIQQS